jgi:hypothetical protein
MYWCSEQLTELKVAAGDIVLQYRTAIPGVFVTYTYDKIERVP